MAPEGDGGRGREGARAAAAREVAVTERGTFFGYGDLVVDMRNFARLREATGAPGDLRRHPLGAAARAGPAGASGGEREYIPALLAAAAVAGADGFFLETHPDPARAPSDAATQWPLDRLPELLDRTLDLWRARVPWRLTRRRRRPRSGCWRSTWTACSPTTASGRPDRRRAGGAEALRHPGRPRAAAAAHRRDPGALAERAALRGDRAPRRGAAGGRGAPGPGCRRSSTPSRRCCRGVGSAGTRSPTSGDDLADLQVLRRVGLADRGRQRGPRGPRGRALVTTTARAATAPCARSSTRCSRRGELGRDARALLHRAREAG